MCPKTLKIMLVDAYNASIILKCLYMPIILKIMPHNLPKPTHMSYKYKTGVHGIHQYKCRGPVFPRLRLLNYTSGGPHEALASEL